MWKYGVGHSFFHSWQGGSVVHDRKRDTFIVQPGQRKREHVKLGLDRCDKEDGSTEG